MSNVIISRKEKGVFHELWCPYAKRIKKENRQERPEEIARKKGYCECKFCRSVRGIVYKYRQDGFNVFYGAEDNTFCLRTNIGFWKLKWYENIQMWHLFHMNNKGYKSFNPELPTKVLMKGSFHRQEDFMKTSSVSKAVNYILAHDRSYQTLEEGGLKRLPRNSPKQKLHYRQAKNKQRKESIRNVYKILKNLKGAEK